MAGWLSSVDGIGGAAKSHVRRRVMSKGASARIVQSAYDFATVAQACLKDVTVLHVPQIDIAEFIAKEQTWKTVKKANGISKVHVLICIGGSCVELLHTDMESKPFGRVTYEAVEEIE